MKYTRAWQIVIVLGVIGLIGCGSTESTDVAFQGSGLPPGDPDIGGVVVADAEDVQTSQDDTVGLVGAEVVLLRGRREVGRTQTGPEGYFRFEHPLSGNYVLKVTPPEGSGLAGARREFYHTRGQQTFLRLQLQRADGDQPGSGGGSPVDGTP
ncbi:MAG: hypothetical protein ACLFWB_13780 [Armatimonadota bacterium]